MNKQKYKKKLFLFVFLTVALATATKHTSKAATQTEQIKIIYTVDLSTTATGLSSDYLYDDTAVPTVQGKNTYTKTITYNNSTTLEKLSDEYVTPYDSVTEKDTGDRKLLKFTGWKVNNTSTILAAGKKLTWSQLSNYASNGTIKLTTTWKNDFQNYEYANFYINYKSEALDSEGDVSISRDEENFTPSLWATYVGNSNAESESVVGSTKDNSFKVNSEIRALYGDKGDNSIYLLTFPSDEYILERLKSYVDVLSIDGQSINKDELDLEHYSLRWYVFKLQKGCWHIDGKLVRNEGKMTVTKTFIGPGEAIQKVTTNTEKFYINVKGGNTDINLYIDDATTSDSQTYTWVIDIKYGINYTLSEHNYIIDRYVTESVNKIVDPDNIQTTSSIPSTTANVVGINNYAIDSTETLDPSKILSVNFTNTYISTASINPMPMTGGQGIYNFYNIGIVLMVCSGFTIYLLKKKGK